MVSQSETAERTPPGSWQLRVKDRVAMALLWLAAAAVCAMLLWLVADILVRGIPQLSLLFLVAAPADAGRSGGIGPVIVSTILILSVALLTSGPLALATAVALSDQPQRQSRLRDLVRGSLDVLAAVPSIVFGLFGNAFFCIVLGMGYSILAGGLTLGCMVLPVLIRTLEQALRAVPDEFRYAAASLGFSRTSILLRIVLPTAAPAMAAGIVLAVGRALAETAALIFTAGYVARMPGSVLDSGRALSVHIYDLAMNVPAGGSQASATAAVLIVLLLAVNLTAGLLMRLVGRQTTPESQGWK